MPSKSQNEQAAAGIALAVKRGKLPKSKLWGASLQMYKSMSAEQLEEFASTKTKGLPKKKKGVGEGFRKYIKGRKGKARKKKR